MMPMREKGDADRDRDVDQVLGVPAVEFDGFVDHQAVIRVRFHHLRPSRLFSFFFTITPSPFGF